MEAENGREFNMSCSRLWFPGAAEAHAVCFMWKKLIKWRDCDARRPSRHQKELHSPANAANGSQGGRRGGVSESEERFSVSRPYDFRRRSDLISESHFILDIIFCLLTVLSNSIRTSWSRHKNSLSHQTRGVETFFGSRILTHSPTHVSLLFCSLLLLTDSPASWIMS